MFKAFASVPPSAPHKDQGIVSTLLASLFPSDSPADGPPAKTLLELHREEEEAARQREERTQGLGSSSRARPGCSRA
jgi:hypothetical protein